MSPSSPSSAPPIDFKVLLAEFDASGLRAAAFARSRGIASWRLYHALRRRSGVVERRRGVARAKAAALLPVHVIDTKPASQPYALELVVAGNHRVLISPGFDAQTLRRLIEALAPC
jgi:hypothetical protein